MNILDIDHIISAEDTVIEQQYGQEELDAAYEEAWRECMELYGDQLGLSVDVIRALDAVSTSPLDFHSAKAREYKELCDYSLMPREKQIAYELRRMGL